MCELVGMRLTATAEIASEPYIVLWAIMTPQQETISCSLLVHLLPKSPLTFLNPPAGSATSISSSSSVIPGTPPPVFSRLYCCCKQFFNWNIALPFSSQCSSINQCEGSVHVCQGRSAGARHSLMTHLPDSVGKWTLQKWPRLFGGGILQLRTPQHRWPRVTPSVTTARRISIRVMVKSVTSSE